MMPQPGNWLDVEVDTYIQGDDGSAWRCVEKAGEGDHLIYKLVNRNRQYVKVMRYWAKPVTLLVPTPSEATGLIHRMLGGQIIKEEP